MNRKRIARELLKIARNLTGGLNVVKPNARRSLNIPENFDVVEDFKKPGIKVYSGGNDWETPPTCFMILRPSSNGSSERLWVELTPPEGCDNFGYITDDEKEAGLDEEEKSKRIKERGEEFWEKWESAVREMHEASYDGAKGLPSDLRTWAQALVKNEELHPYVELCGSDRTDWKKTDLFKEVKR